MRPAPTLRTGSRPTAHSVVWEAALRALACMRVPGQVPPAPRTTMKMLPRKHDKPHAVRRDAEDLFDRFLRNWEENWLTAMPGDWDHPVFPPVDVAETENDYVVTVDLPGVEPKDIDIQVLGQNLLITGERKSEQQQEEDGYLRREVRFGSFKRTIPLPEGARISRDDVKAKYRNGILRIQVPKATPTPTLRIPVHYEA